MTDEDLRLQKKREEDIMKIAGVETRLKVAFWSFYLDPTSPTLMNAHQSALAAGFDEAQARAVTSYKWFKSSTRKATMYETAEDALEYFAKFSITTTKVLKDGTEVEVIDPALAKIKQDTAKYITSTLGKKDYSMRNELTGKQGGAIETKKVSVSDEEFDEILKQYATKRSNEGGKESISIEASIQ